MRITIKRITKLTLKNHSMHIFDLLIAVLLPSIVFIRLKKNMHPLLDSGLEAGWKFLKVLFNGSQVVHKLIVEGLRKSGRQGRIMVHVVIILLTAISFYCPGLIIQAIAQRLQSIIYMQDIMQNQNIEKRIAALRQGSPVSIPIEDVSILLQDFKTKDLLPIVRYLLNMIDRYHLNVLRLSKMKVHNVTLIEYIIERVLDGNQDPYLTDFIVLYHRIASEVNVPQKTLQTITRCLYNNCNFQPSVAVITLAYTLLQCSQQQCHSYIYYDNVIPKSNNGLKLLFNTPKWIFHKGMTILIWLQKNVQMSTIVIKIQSNEGTLLLRAGQQSLILEYTKKNNTTIVEQMKFNFEVGVICNISIALVPNASVLPLFVSRHNYNFVVKMGRQECHFATLVEMGEQLIELSMFHNFCGKIYSVAVLNTVFSLNAYSEHKVHLKFPPCGPHSEQTVWDIIDQEALPINHIVAIYNANRHHKGLLINYVGDQNHACYDGEVKEVKEERGYLPERLILVYYALLYMLKVGGQSEETQKQRAECMDLLVKHLIKILCQRVNVYPSPEYYFYFLYFLELHAYNLPISTLINFAEMLEHPSFSPIKHYIDFALIQSKLGQESHSDFPSEICDPVEKLQLLFYLEDKWKSTFNSLQKDWFLPAGIRLQKEDACDPKDYKYVDKLSLIEYEVMDFITNDNCKCILQPIFKLPKKWELSTYRSQYLRKECLEEPCFLKLQAAVPRPQKRVVAKISPSRLQRISKRLILREDVGQQEVEFILQEDYRVECIKIELLTLIYCDLVISVEGYLLLTNRYRSKSYSHMCIKADQHEHFCHVEFHYQDIKHITVKRYNQFQRALQIKLHNGLAVVLYFLKPEPFQNVIILLQKYVSIRKDPYDYYMKSTITSNWIDKTISNFQYLQQLNQITGRSYYDITQYLVLPWLLVEEGEFRDLRKNMGSFGPQERIAHFMEKFATENEEELFNEYHFGTHYSSSAIVLNYMIRLRPFSVGSFTLQSGRFDCADRVFHSYLGSWVNATLSPTDIRELIPQMYTLPELYLNCNNYDFGLTQDGQRIDNVELPAWSKDPYHFVVALRRALESETVSKAINNWIDLIYGFKQRGKPAIESMNIFFPLTYEFSIDVEKIEDVEERISIETQIAHFGQTPSQIIGKNPHPQRIKISKNSNLLAEAKNPPIYKFMASKRQKYKAEKMLFGTAFEPYDSVMSITYIASNLILALQKHGYSIYKLSTAPTKQFQANYVLQTCKVAFNYQQLNHELPVCYCNQILFVGGFYNGYLQLIFTGSKGYKYNRCYKFLGTATITALASYQNMVYVGDHLGCLHICKIQHKQTQVQIQNKNFIIEHSSRINSIRVSAEGNLLVTAGQDGFFCIHELYEGTILGTQERLYINFKLQANVSMPILLVALFTVQLSTNNLNQKLM